MNRYTSHTAHEKCTDRTVCLHITHDVTRSRLAQVQVVPSTKWSFHLLRNVSRHARNTQHIFLIFFLCSMSLFPLFHVYNGCSHPEIPALIHENTEGDGYTDPESLIDFESGVFTRSLKKKCASFEPVAELEYCQIGMTATVMGDVNAVCTLECAHRRQVPAVRALNERSLLIRGLPFPRMKTTGDENIDDLVILSVLQFSDVHAASLPIEVQRADALYDVLQMPTNAGKSGSTLAGEIWRGRADVDVHKILMLIMLGFHGIALLISKTKCMPHVVKCASTLVPRHPC